MPAAADSEMMYVYKGGRIVYAQEVTAVDDVQVAEDHSRLTILDKEGATLYESPMGDVDSLSFRTPAMRTDGILDVVFHADGTAADVSASQMKVEHYPDATLSTYWNATYGRYVARSTCAWNDKDKGHYRISYAGNDAFWQKLADGYTMEAIVMSTDKQNTEAKWIGSHQSGGPGATMVSGDGKLSFLPHTGDYRWTKTDWETGVYYHVVGVYDHDAGKAYLYVDGELRSVAEAPGELTKPTSDSKNHFFAIFGDPQNGGCQQQLPGEVVTFRIYDTAVNAYEARVLSEAAHPVQGQEADLLDVVFHADGTATDVSPAHRKVDCYPNSTLYTYWLPQYGRYVAHSDASWNDSGKGHYRVDYAGDDNFWQQLADGYTMEAVVMTPEIVAGTEAKWISSHQGGGPGGFMVSTDGQLAYLPHTGNAYRWTKYAGWSGGAYYHMVGVYDRDAAKVHLYVNGELKATADAPNGLTKPGSDTRNHFFAIFGDPSGDGGCNQQIPGDVVMFRIYSTPSSAEQVEQMWLHARPQVVKSDKLVTDVAYPQAVPAKVGAVFPIMGSGFAQGDVAQFTANASGRTFEVPLALADDGATVLLPEALETDRYTMSLLRGGVVQRLGTVSFTMVDALPASSQIIAHRGYWKAQGASQNSRASLQAAQAIGAYGSETDVWLTTDNQIMVNHDASYSGVTIQDSKYADCKNLTLSNGEKMPRLDDLLQLLKDSDSPTKLIIEIKKHSTDLRNRNAAKYVLKKVEEYGVKDRVEYISFSGVACRQIISLDPEAKVAYLNGDYSPAALKRMGYTGLDYSYSVMNAHPEWYQQAHDEGLTVNVWTVSDYAGMVDVMSRGADYITSDSPTDGLLIKKYFDLNR